MKTRFFKKKKKYDPYEESIIRTFQELHRTVTPSEVAEYLGIHPNTAKKRIKNLCKKGYIDCDKQGNRLYCKRNDKIILLSPKKSRKS